MLNTTTPASVTSPGFGQGQDFRTRSFEKGDEGRVLVPGAAEIGGCPKAEIAPLRFDLRG